MIYNKFNIKKQKITSAVIIISIAVLMVLSLSFIIKEAEHNCSGENCSVCICIGQCLNNIKINAGGTSSKFSIDIVVGFVILYVLLSENILISETPVSHKVRMDN